MATYTQSVITYGLSTLSSPTTISLTDDSSQQLTLPFTYTFFGTAYTSLYVNSNGVVQFASAQAVAITGSPSSNSYPTLVGCGTDLVPSGSTTPKYQTLGSSPDRIFVVDFTSIPFYNSSTGGASTTIFATFQIKLFETSNDAEIHVGGFNAAGSGDYGFIGVALTGGSDMTTTNNSASVNVSSTAYRYSAAAASPIAVAWLTV